VSVQRPPVSEPAASEIGEAENLRIENARLQAALAEAERRSSLLQAELQRRVRNALAIVESVVRRTARTSETLEYYSTHLEGRIAAISRGQKLAVLMGAERGIDLEFLLAEELLAHGAHEGHLVDLSGPQVELRGAAVVSLGLAFHELAINSVKFGALSSALGRIAITWGIEPADSGGESEGFLRLDWIETGSRVLPDVPRREGFGTELIKRMLAYELAAETSLNFAPEGLHCTIRLPLAGNLELTPLDRVRDEHY